MILILSFPVQAQAVCLPADKVESLLGDRYGERVVGKGIAQPGVLIEHWINAEKGTFTFVVTTPDGISCITSVGEDWQTVERVSGTPIRLHY